MLDAGGRVKEVQLLAQLEKGPDGFFCPSRQATFPGEAAVRHALLLRYKWEEGMFLAQSPQSEGRLVSNSNAALEALWSPGTQKLINTVFLD